MSLTARIAMVFMLATSICEAEPDATARAIGALEQLHTAVGVGMNLEEYNRRVIDAKVQAEPALGEAGEAQASIRGVLEYYERALDVWRWKLRHHELKSREYEIQYRYFGDNPEVTRWGGECPTSIIKEPSGFFKPGTISGSWAPDIAISCFWEKAGNALSTAKQSVSLSAAASPQSLAPKKDPQERLRDLRRLLDQKLITSAEYDAKRVEILDDL